MTAHNPECAVREAARGHRPRLQSRGIMMKRTIIFIAALLASYTNSAQNGPCVVSGRGFFRIHVGTGGVFGAFAHDHLIEAQKVEGCAMLDARDLTHSSIKLSFEAAAVRVMDPKENAKDRATV